VGDFAGVWEKGKGDKFNLSAFFVVADWNGFSLGTGIKG
jgi:hypothetical protein